MEHENYNSIEEMQRRAKDLERDITAMEAIDSAKAWQQVSRRIRQRRHHMAFEHVVRFAAMLALPLLLTSIIFGYLYFHKSASDITYASVSAPVGSVVKYELPDKSIVWLNGGSTLRYPTTFDSKRREVELRGEGFFEVKADTKHPFYVNTMSGLSVYVYGTRFNVAAYDDEDYVETLLEQGRVRVILPEGGKEQTIVPGEQFLYCKSSRQTSLTKVDVFERASWREGKLIFRNAPLEDIFRRLERKFNVKICLTNHRGKTYHYRATFDDETLTQILDCLSKSVSMKWQIVSPQRQPDDTFSKQQINIDLY